MDNQIKEEVRTPFRKPHAVLIKFRTMSDIILTEDVWFDGHGNLCHYSREKSHIAPCYFHYLGKMKSFPHECTFPSWIIEKEYADIFEPNMALRMIASGNLEKDRCVEVAKKAVLVP